MKTFVGSWRTLALRGAVALAFGLTALLWPGITLAMLVLLFGVYALIDGALTITLGARHLAQRRAWIVGLEGFAGLGLGLAVLAWTHVAAELLVVAIALWAIATGLLEWAAAVRLRREVPEEVLLAIAGTASVALGVAILFWPTTGTIALVLMLAGYAVIFGTSMIVQAFRLRRVVRGPEGEHPHVRSRPHHAV